MIMLDEVAACLSNHNKKSVEEIKAFVSRQENYVDEMNEAITPFLVKCTRMSSANHDNRVQLSKMMQITDGLESLSDECCAVMHTVAKYIGSKGLDIKSESFAKIVSYMNQVHDFFEYVSQHIVLGLTEGELEFSPELRQQIQQRMKTQGKEALFAELELYDPEYAKKININDEYRICRALEVFYTSGKPLSSYKTPDVPRSDFDFCTIILNRTKDDLYSRIDLRIEKMFELGLAEEVECLKKMG